MAGDMHFCGVHCMTVGVRVCPSIGPHAQSHNPLCTPLAPTQLLIVDLIANHQPGDREVIWVYDEIGGAGRVLRFLFDTRACVKLGAQENRH